MKSQTIHFDLLAYKLVDSPAFLQEEPFNKKQEKSLLEYISGKSIPSEFQQDNRLLALSSHFVPQEENDRDNARYFVYDVVTENCMCYSEYRKR